ncbi:MAG TPA: isoamylase [Chloroflexaceae bacterium]|nr:isoamylase [Chloroflexaceae bacterium]
MHSEAGLLRSVDAWEASEGAPAPLGATWVEAQGAYNFALYSRSATAVTLLLYSEADPATPLLARALDPRHNKTGRIWHCMVPADQLRGATLYAYRVEGPCEPERGLRHDAEKILLDPYALEVFFPPSYSRIACARPGPTDGLAPLGILPTRPVAHFDWGEDPRPRHTHDLIVYELHVKGFTARATSGVTPAKRGTFAGLIEKIPYLLDLGVTVVELLPVHQFDPQEGNYWGYMTLNFFAPHATYAAGDPMVEFRQMVRAFHEAGLQVWIDVVYNHTSEGDAGGPTYSFRGIDNRSYYLLEADRARYVNDTGCGNTLRCGHPAVRALVVESLRHWTDEMHLDGYRFDLASILTRPAAGPADWIDPGLISEISAYGYANDVTLVAEAWDIASYQLGRSFPGQIWRQWNGKFRDDLRSFVRGDRGMVPALMQRLYGSDDLFPDSLPEAYRPFQSVNFITAHDGFCLYDLTAYNRKHNFANGHGNTDGADDNRSWNCGWEGDAGAPQEVLALRRRQVKNFFALLMLANGTPMFCAGDEFLNTQGGNNNPYNQDNETTWLNWELLAQNGDVFRFFKHMIAFRKAHRSIGRSTYWREEVSWHGVGREPDLAEHSHSLAYCLRGASQHDGDLYVLINAYWEELSFTVQEGAAGEWLRVVDTGRPSPDDILEPGHEQPVPSLTFRAGPRSVVVLYRPPREG